MAGKWLNDEELMKILDISPDDIEPESEKVVSQKEDIDSVEGDFSDKKMVDTHPVYFEDLTETIEVDSEMAEFELLYDVPVEVRVLLGSIEKTIEEILELVEGSILSTERLAGEPVEIMVSNQVIAKGEVVVIDDKFGVLITEIVSPRERIQHVQGKLRRQKQ